jgi:2-polyprenyl-6-methoxyphenol hydroxylase-like FAD-dependent oxidoreductase
VAHRAARAAVIRRGETINGGQPSGPRWSATSPTTGGWRNLKQDRERFYLQVEPGGQPDDYDDEEIWTQLQTRLAADGEVLMRGPIVEKSILDLRSYVTQPMRAGPLFLAGDAAHIVTPAGGKAMNLALQDVAELVEGLLSFYRSGDRGRLDA